MSVNIEQNNEPQASDPVSDQFNGLRERLRATLTRQNLSMASASKLAGIGDSTLSAFMAGTYKGNNQRCADLLKIWVDSQDAALVARASLLEEMPFVATTSAKAFIGALEYAQFLADCTVIIGGGGVGKSTAAEFYIRTHPNVWMVTADATLAKPRAILNYIAEKLGVPETKGDKMSRAIAARMAGTQGLLIVDEAHKLGVEGLDVVRSLHDRSKVGIALVGNEKVWTRLEGGTRSADYAPLFSRVGMQVKVPKPTPSDIDMMLDATGIEEPAQRKMLKVIAGRPGALRELVKTLRLARQALEPGEPLSVAHLTYAYNRRSNAAEAA